MECINLVYKSIRDIDSVKDKVNCHQPDQVLIQVFCGDTREENVLAIQQELIQAFPGIPILGATTSGEIISSKITEKQTVISFMLLNDTKVHTSYVDDNKGSSSERIARCVQSQNPNLVILFGTGLLNKQIRENYRHIQTISAECPGTLIAGGLAGADIQSQTSYVFTEKNFGENASVAATLTGKSLHCWSYRNDGWIPIGKKMVINNTKGGNVLEIDHKNVREIYQYYLGVEFDFTAPQNPTLEFPLVSVQDGILIKNIPIEEDTDGSFRFLHKLSQGEKVRFSFCDLSLLETGALRIKKGLIKKAPEAIFIYSCGTRKRIFGGDIVFESKTLSDITNTCGFFTYGEFYTERSVSHILIQNMTVLALSENESVIKTAEDSDTYQDPEKGNQYTIKTLKILTNLISATSKDLEMSNQKLSVMATKDSTTNLYNRRFFDQALSMEVKKHNRSDSPLSLILLDIDYFKYFNDQYGHVAGDECLMKIAHIMRQSLERSTDIAFRYGGEEMGCLLPATDFSGASALAERIRHNIETAKIPHCRSDVSQYVTASIGFITIYTNQEIPSNSEIIEKCDQCLYQAKHQGRNQTVGHEVDR